jgi:hypothetical protein
LHKLGNLVLVTRSINSEYADHPYEVKQAKYNDKKTKGSFDSLKSDLIYQNHTWNDQKAEEHEKQIFKILKGYFEKTKPVLHFVIPDEKHPS